MHRTYHVTNQSHRNVNALLWRKTLFRFHDRGSVPEDAIVPSHRHSLSTAPKARPPRDPVPCNPLLQHLCPNDVEDTLRDLMVHRWEVRREKHFFWRDALREKDKSLLNDSRTLYQGPDSCTKAIHIWDCLGANGRRDIILQPPVDAEAVAFEMWERLERVFALPADVSCQYIYRAFVDEVQSRSLPSAMQSLQKELKQILGVSVNIA